MSSSNRNSCIRGLLIGSSSFSIPTLLLFGLVVDGPSATVTAEEAQPQLPPVVIERRGPRRARVTRAPTQQKGAPRRVATRRPLPATVPPAPGAPAPGAGAEPTAVAIAPGVNLNAVPERTGTNRLNLSVRETPASVDVIDARTIQEQGYRTNVEVANGATGVQAIDAAGAPANFLIRGFTFGEVSPTYNGISTGPANITSRVMDLANLSQVEFLKGPSSLMTGLNAIGGSVNYVSRQPTTGPVRSELDLSGDSIGTLRSHYGSGGSTGVQGLDYRFDAIGSRIDGYIDDVHRGLTGLSGQFNYRANNAFTAFFAYDYKKDSGHAYWGTPLIPVSFAGPFAKGGVVSGSAISTFDGSLIAPVTFDRRTRRTNYNVSDDKTGAEELWLRTGFEYTPVNNVSIKNQTYFFQARRHWLDAETYAFDTTTNSTIDRDRFFVGHHQHIIGNNTDLLWDANIYGMDNRFAAQLQASSNKITFTQFAGGFPEDTVDVINPVRGSFGILEPDVINKRLDSTAISLEDRLKVTPWLALIGGVRFEHMSLDSSRVNFDLAMPPANNFKTSWNPFSYRAAVTVEPVRNLMFYAMTATAFDPAAAGIFSVANRPTSSFELASARTYEAGVKQSLWDNRAEWTFSAYDITRNNVFVLLTNNTGSVAGEIKSKGVEFAAAVRPYDGWKLWGNLAFVEARYKNFDPFTGNTPSNVAPWIINGGASYRWEHDWRWPVEVGGSVRHVAHRFLFEDDLTKMESFTTADVYAFVDIPGRDFGRPELNNMRVSFRVRNLTNTVYAAFSDPGYQDQFYLGLPRTYELGASFRW